VSLRPDEFTVPPPTVIEVRRRADGTFAVAGPHQAEFGHRIPNEGLDDGIFAGWSWNGHALHAWVDRYGMWPLFYAGDDQNILVSDSLTALVPKLRDRALDAGAIEVFLGLGFFIENDTPLAGIRAFPPGGHLTWDGTLAITGAPFTRPSSGLAFEQAVDGYIELFRQAIKRRRPDQVIKSLPLTGGRDSRHIALELRESGCAVAEYVTTSKSGDAGCSDIIEARRLALLLGGRHVVIEAADSILSWEQKKNEITHFCADEHGWIAPVFAYLAHRGPSFDGIAGDVLSATLNNSPDRSELMRAGAYEQLARELLQEWSLSSDALRVVRPLLDLPAVHADDVAGRLAKTLAQFSEHPNPMSAFFFWNRTRRAIALSPFGLGRTSPIYAPFLDHAVFDLLASLPPEFSFDGRLHDAALVQAYGELGSVPRAYPPRTWVRERVRQSRAAPIVRAIMRRLKAPVARRVSDAHGVLRTIYAMQLHQHLENASPSAESP
jgi:asparagine synthase (glutamine-hydrolysing)